MQLVVVSSPVVLHRESELITAVLDQGLRTLHMRKPGLNAQAYEDVFKDLPAAARNKLVLHDHHNLVGREMHLDGVSRRVSRGVHYSEAVRAAAGQIQAVPGLTASTALHRLDQLDEDLGDIDYAFLSPIFNSISKAGYLAAFSDRFKLTAAVTACRFPVFALGGIDETKVQDAASLGFAGVAVLGSVWSSPDPAGSVRKLLAACAAIS